jgi:predicted SAM-dependent methyltransferase
VSTNEPAARSPIVARLRKRARRGISHVVRNRSLHVRWERVRSREYLDLGCGSNLHPQFVNLDYQWHPGIDICWDVARGIPLADGSVKGIFSEHCLEHMPLETGDYVLGECFRVLAPGGTVRIVVPDGELYLGGYAAIRDGHTERSLPYAERDEYQGMYSPIMSVNRIFGEFGHRFIYDFDTLRQLLERRGFDDIARAAFGEGRDPVLLIDTPRRAPESLYVEATKPATSVR